MKAKISIITLGVKDLNISLRFYTTLGFKTHNYKESDGYVMFEMDGTWLALFPKQALAEDAGLSSQNLVPEISLANNVSSEKEVDEVFMHFIKAGGKEIKPPQKTDWGGYSGYVADPDGYLWEIAYNPYTDLT